MICFNRHSAINDNTPLLLDLLPICYVEASDRTGTPYRRRADMMTFISKLFIFRIKLLRMTFICVFSVIHLICLWKLSFSSQTTNPDISGLYRVLPLHLSDKRTGDKQCSLHLTGCQVQSSHSTQRVNVCIVSNSYYSSPQWFSRC